MANNTTYEQIQSLQLSNPFLVFSSNNDPHKQFIHALFGNQDGINVEIENNLKHIININTFSLTIDYFQKRFISKTTSKILSKYGIDKDKQIIGLIIHLIVASKYDYPMHSLKNSIIWNSKEYISLMFRSDQIGINIDVQKIKEWMTWEKYLKKARFSSWKYLKIIMANLSLYMDKLKPDESIAPSIIKDILESVDHELIRNKPSPTKTISDILFRAKNPKVKYCDCIPSQHDFEQRKWDEIGFTLF